MKALLKILGMLLVLSSCSMFEDDVLPLSVELSSAPAVFNVGDSVTITAVIKGGSGGNIILWKLDQNSYTSSSSESFSFKSSAMSHSVQCSVSSGEQKKSKSIAVTSAGYGDLSPVERYGKLKVEGANLCDKNGESIQLRGMSTHGIQYFDQFYTKNLITSLALYWKADIIRISCYVNEGNSDYLDSPAKWRTYVDSIVDMAGEAGIYALIDWHMLSPGDPNYFKNEAKEFWKYMVDKHGNKTHVLFDICNEPNNEGHWSWKYDKEKGDFVKDKEIVPGKTVTWDNDIKPYADTILAIIRAKSQNVAIVGTPEWASEPDAVIGNELNYRNIMYTMHFYAAEHGSSYRDNVSRALLAGIPVFVTEFGTQEASGDGDNDFVASEEWMTFMNDNNLSWCNWNLSNDFRTGAVYLENFKYSTTTTAATYADSANMKEAGKWIFNKIKNR